MCGLSPFEDLLPRQRLSLRIPVHRFDQHLGKEGDVAGGAPTNPHDRGIVAPLILAPCDQIEVGQAAQGLGANLDQCLVGHPLAEERPVAARRPA